MIVEKIIVGGDAVRILEYDADGISWFIVGIVSDGQIILSG